MTGYGRGECTEEGFKITVEISTVNRKQAELNLAIPRELEALEPKVREAINRRVARGRVNLKLGFHPGDGASVPAGQINIALARAYAQELKVLAADLGISTEITLDILVRAPGVFQPDLGIADVDSFWPAVEKALNHALEGMLKMRTAEGGNLENDLRGRVENMRGSIDLIKAQAPEMVKRYTETLRQRVAAAGLPLPPEDDERLLKEIVYFADRSDISEEITRMESHFKQFQEVAQSKEPVGRTLDFLAQEFNREINTIGSKANDNLISREVVLLKAELEKFREQVQNVE